MYNLTRGDTIGPYPFVIEQKLGGQGGMSEVYLAVVRKQFQKILKASKVVVKIAGDSKLDTNNRGISNEEAYLNDLQHIGVVKMIPIWGETKTYRVRATPLAGEPWFCVFEYIPGGSLAEILRKSRKGLPLQQTLNTAKNLAAILAYLHGKGVVHMDLKPSNVLFRQPTRANRTGQAVLIDFGIARTIGEVSASGTAAYMAPERRDSAARQVAHPSMDVYALGVLLSEMLTGHTPSAKDLAPASQWRSRASERDLVAHSLDPLIVQTMSPDWRQRPSAQVVADELERSGVGKSRKRVMQLIVALLIIGGVVCLIFFGATMWKLSQT